MSLEKINQLKQRKATLSIETKKLVDEETHMLLLIQQYWENEVKIAEQEHAEQEAKLKLLIDENREVVDIILKQNEPTISTEVITHNNNNITTTILVDNVTTELQFNTILQDMVVDMIGNMPKKSDQDQDTNKSKSKVRVKTLTDKPTTCNL